ncbi:hypothetical protein CDAR_402171 [Caerostris darwini]|uniref:Uncharacterized protein n=1 Tax=Caerostris darwini TaxID=1538125 RepID=A0AAV4T227_9ARAC|nr:hypothetical protein CDAR_402171 [Caerostris darwini]
MATCDGNDQLPYSNRQSNTRTDHRCPTERVATHGATGFLPRIRSTLAYCVEPQKQDILKSIDKGWPEGRKTAFDSLLRKNRSLSQVIWNGGLERAHEATTRVLIQVHSSLPTHFPT